MSGGLVYTVPLDALSVTNDSDQDIVIIGANSGTTLEILELRVTSAHTTAEPVRLRLIRRTSAGTGGSSITPNAINEGNTAAANFTASSLVTTPGTGGAVLHGWQWNQQSELLFLPVPETIVTVSASQYLALHLQTAMGGTRTWSGSVTVRQSR
jgi:hypothetical protein